MSQSTAARNKAIVLEAFDTLFNKRDYAAAERFWSPNYVQHSAHIEPGRDGLFNLIKSMPPTFKHEHEQIVADGELVIVHSRFSGFGQAKNWIVADFVRVVDGLLVEHWDVVEDEASGGRLQERAADVRRSVSCVAAPHQWVEAVWLARGPGSSATNQWEGSMANVVKKHSISSELAQKMVNEALAKARELGVTENVAILDDGGNLKAFSRMDGASIPTIEIAQSKAYTALFGVSTQDLFNFIQGDPSLLAGIPTLPRVAAWGGGFPIKVDDEIVGAIGVSGAPKVENDVDCARAALALVPDAVPTD
jgi:uncharacterized protein GlcG (DUF336 family)/predicted SnoaL-like aldol condensation-catalyzing enzyme